jgi:hypothetical protein
MKETTKSQKILLHSGYTATNIGNAFFTMGAKALIKAAAPYAEIYEASTMPRYNWMYRPQRVKTKTFSEKVAGKITAFGRPRNSSDSANVFTPFADNTPYEELLGDDKSFDLFSEIDCDVIVVAGMMLAKQCFYLIGPSLKKAARKGKKIIFLGVGGEFYSQDEVELCKKWLNDLKPIALSSRDDTAFQIYGNLVAETFQGIDCAYFLEDAFLPPRVAAKPYAVFNFDSIVSPQISCPELNIVDAHHSFSFQPCDYFKGVCSSFISDLPQDYLTLYANATEVHSDRVHACVAAMAFGVPAKFYGKTRRDLLFCPVGADKINNELIKIDKEKLKSTKCRSIQWLTKILSEC